MLEDQRLGDPGRAGDVVDRRAVVALGGEDVERGGQERGAALRRGQASTGHRPRSVPRMPDWAVEGLLDGLEGRARDERAELLDWLHDEGFGLEDLRRAHDDGLLPFLPAERAVMGGPGRSR